MFFLSCVCYVFVRVCWYVPCGHLLGKGWPLGSRLWCLTVSLSLSHWYPGSGVVHVCIDSWSLHPYLLYCMRMKGYLHLKSLVAKSKQNNIPIIYFFIGFHHDFFAIMWNIPTDWTVARRMNVKTNSAVQVNSIMISPGGRWDMIELSIAMRNL